MQEVITRPVETIAQEVLPIAMQTPFGIPSESSHWYQHTLAIHPGLSSVIVRSEATRSPVSLTGTGKQSYTNKEIATVTSFPRNDKAATIIMAHPDDEDFVGGTIATLAEKGYEVTLVTITDGRLGIDHRAPLIQQDLVHTRLEETIASARELGIHRVINLGIPDKEAGKHPEVGDILVDVFTQFPSSVYITHANPKNPNTIDYHEDHLATTPLVLEAIEKSADSTRPLPTVFYADTQGARNDVGVVKRFNSRKRRWEYLSKASSVDILIDISRAISKKQTAFAYHASQVYNTPEDIQTNYVIQSLETAKFRAGQARRMSHPIRSLLLQQPQFAEGLSIHTGHGFNTDPTIIFNPTDIWTPKKIFTRRAAPIFT